MKTEPLPLYLAFTIHFYITLQMLHKLFSLSVNCLWRCWTPDAGTNLYIQLLAYWRFFWCVSFEDKHVEFCVTTQLRSLRQCRALVHFSWYWKACISLHLSEMYPFQSSPLWTVLHYIWVLIFLSRLSMSWLSSRFIKQQGCLSITFLCLHKLPALQVLQQDDRHLLKACSSFFCIRRLNSIHTSSDEEGKLNRMKTDAGPPQEEVGINCSEQKAGTNQFFFLTVSQT